MRTQVDRSILSVDGARIFKPIKRKTSRDGTMIAVNVAREAWSIWSCGRTDVKSKESCVGVGVVVGSRAKFGRIQPPMQRKQAQTATPGEGGENKSNRRRRRRQLSSSTATFVLPQVMVSQHAKRKFTRFIRRPPRPRRGGACALA